MLGTIVLLAALLAKPPADDLAPVIDNAVRLYDEGRYEEAKVDLEGLDAAGAADGPLLYRLFFCERAVGHEAEALKALGRAQQALEKEIVASRTIDVPFYLANAYSNLGKAAEAQAVAREAIAKLDKGTYAAPKTAIGAFQVGKLYQDLGQADNAVRWYTKALDGFDLKGGRYAGNARWALRYVGNVAYARDDFAGSEKSFTKLTDLGGALIADWTSLAAARVRTGRYREAAEAWKAAVKLDPGGADDARYAARVTETAAGLAPLPKDAPGGKPFASLVQAELETVLKDQAAAARDLQVRAAEGLGMKEAGAKPHAMAKPLRSELTGRLQAARKTFVTAALEYAVRRFPLRETAFREGYAVLIFQEREWEVPPDP
jgi:tetratricopeptide (TPR) repeat protein